MKRVIAIAAILAASFSAPASADELGVYKTQGACVSAWSHYDSVYWSAAKADGTLSNRGSTYPSPVGCVKIGGLWYLVPVGG